MASGLALMATMTAIRTDDILADETRDAWREYLSYTQGLAAHRYEEVEPWAWKRLQAKLGAIDARRRAAGRGRGL